MQTPEKNYTHVSYMFIDNESWRIWFRLGAVYISTQPEMNKGDNLFFGITQNTWNDLKQQVSVSMVWLYTSCLYMSANDMIDRRSDWEEVDGINRMSSIYDVYCSSAGLLDSLA